MNNSMYGFLIMETDEEHITSSSQHVQIIV